MKGFTSETLVVCGTFLFGQNSYFGSFLISLGIVSSFVRFIVNFNRDSKLDKMLEAGEKIATTIVEASNIVSSESKKSYWENFTNKKAY